ncbi:MAG: hypothetical protein QNJ97_19215 [Myxococcota bacterium]|nr:hypothetical protein [Myxococcota bacterium]
MKKSRFLTTVVLTLLTCLCVYATVSIFRGSESNDKNDIEVIAKNKAAKDNTQTKQRTEQRKKARPSQLEMKNAFQALNHLGMYDENGPTAEELEMAAEKAAEEAAMTDEEKAIETAKHKEIAEHFWERAPRVIEKMLNEEREDYSWTNHIESAGSSFLQEKELGGTEIRSVDCRETICRVEFIHADDEARKKFEEDGRADGPWTGDQYGRKIVLEDGRVGKYVYFGKDMEPSFTERFHNNIVNKEMYM